MTDDEHSHHTTGSWRNFWLSRGGVVFLIFLAMGGALLFTEHRAHVLGALPWLFLLACPLMHVFMHGGHGGHGGHGHPKDQTAPDREGSTGAWDASRGSKRS